MAVSSITRAVQKQSRQIPLPESFTKKLGKLKKARKELCLELSQTPTDAQIAQRAGITLEKYTKIIEYAEVTSSLNVIAGGQKGLEVLDLVQSVKKTPWEFIESTGVESKIKDLLSESLTAT
jgi:RNA polymerase primary sigma factor